LIALKPTSLNNWEDELCELAHAPARNHVPATRIAPRHEAALAKAYRHCEAMTRQNSKTFYLASGLLEGSKRDAVRALYAFCRTVDDIVDNDEPDAHAKLALWRQHMAHAGSEHEPVALAWQHARLAFHVPAVYAEQLIDGVQRDMTQVRYQTFAELATYCYGVACTVGLMSMHVIGFAGLHAIPYAIRLGTALQLTNILRDVGEDWRRGRVYLPQDELSAFGLSDEDIEAGAVSAKWQRFMRFQIERNRRLYDQSMAGVALLNADGRFAIQAAADLYRGILDEIERNGYDVFSRRASVSKTGKLKRLPAIWMRSRQGK
jgi:15-cis-phytoene synthase